MALHQRVGRARRVDPPLYFQQRLAAAQVALWLVPGPAAWAVSTRRDTLVLAAPCYALGAPALPALADALAPLPGVAVSRWEDYDGW